VGGAAAAIADPCEIVIRTGQVGGAPGDPTVGGFDDCFRVYESTSCAAPLSGAPFAATDFDAAATSATFAQVVESVAPWLPSLGSDPDARWIHSRRNASGYGAAARSVLYACRFERPAGCTEADITVSWAVDDRLGDPAGDPNPIGVYINGTALSPSFSGGDYTAEYSASVSSYPLLPGVNWLYVYQRDMSCGYAGLMLSARIRCPDTVGDIYGTKYWDQDCNGERDAGEPGLSGWDITASGDSDYVTTTDADGNYSFVGLPGGTYTVFETTVSTWIVTEPVDGTYTVTVGCDPIEDLDFGNCLCDTQQGPDTPPCLDAWYPLDEGSGTIAADLASGNTGFLVGDPAWQTDGMVGGSLWFPSPYDYVETAAGPSPSFGDGSFAVSGWLRINDSTYGTVRALLDKRVSTTGFYVYLDDGMLSLEIRTPGGTSNYVATGGTYLNDGEWHHFAVAACRNPSDPTDPLTNRVTLYVDGVPDATPWTGAAVQMGNVTNNAPLRFARESGGFPTDFPLHGELDEVMLFSCCLDDDDILILAGGDEFATTTVAVPSVLSVTGTTATIPLEICNYLGTPQDYTWTIAGLPSGGGCTIDGPTVFSPLAGTLTLPAGPACEVIDIEVEAPGDLVAGETACYGVSVQQVGTGECFTTTGTLQPSGIIDVSTDDPVVELPTGVGTLVDILLTNRSQDPVLLDYELHTWSRGHDGPSPVMSLNGMPAGIPVIGDVEIDAGASVPVTVRVTMEGYEPFNINELRFVADLHELGLPIPVHAVIVKSEHMGGTLAVPETGQVAEPGPLHVGITPNPFSTGTTVLFELDEASDVRVELFDAAGRLVRDLQTGMLNAGSQTLTWDGRSAAGHQVPSGVYWVRVAAGQRLGVEKVLILR